MSRSTVFTLRVLVAAAMSALAVNAADASFVTPDPDPFLGGMVTTTGSVHTPLGWITTTITNITEKSNSISTGNDYVVYNATGLHTVYTSSSLTTVLTTAAFQDAFEIEIFNRTTPFETGPFSFQILSQTSSGTIEGNAVTVQLNPAKTSGGTTTITAGPLVGEYTVSTTATVYSQYIVNGGPAINVSPVNIVAEAVPEPSTLTLLGTSLAGLIFVCWRRVVRGGQGLHVA